MVTENYTSNCASFIKACIDRDVDDPSLTVENEVRAGTVREVYVRWCETVGVVNRIPSQDFKTCMEIQGICQRRVNNGRRYRRIRIKPEWVHVVKPRVKKILQEF